MNKIFFIVFLFCCVVSELAYARAIPYGDLKFQGSKVKSEDGVIYLEGDEPAIILFFEGLAKNNNLLTVEFKREKAPNRVDIVFDHYDENDKLVRHRKKYYFSPFREFETVVFALDSINQYKGVIKMLSVLFVGMDEKVEIKTFDLEKITTSNYLWARYNELFEYIFFRPPTINYIGGPTWEGAWINKPIVFLLIVPLGIFGIVFVVTDSKRLKRGGVIGGIALIVLFWLFLDFLQTRSQMKMFKQFVTADHIMDNSRVSYRFTGFMDFIRENTEPGNIGYFMVPYPYSKEGPYHLYPHVKFNDKVVPDYVYVFNKPNLYDFSFPVYDAQKMELKHGKIVFQVKRVMPYDEEMAIYEVRK